MVAYRALNAPITIQSVELKLNNLALFAKFWVPEKFFYKLESSYTFIDQENTCVYLLPFIFSHAKLSTQVH